jgi:hypothetical protein
MNNVVDIGTDVEKLLADNVPAGIATKICVGIREVFGSNLSFDTCHPG